MLEPAKLKFRKAFKGRIRGNATSGNSLSFGSFGLKALDRCRLDSKQIEAARKAVNRDLKRKGKLWIRVFPNVPVTKKPADVRMGKGKGSLDRYVFRIKPGRIIFELDGIDINEARIALEKAAAKLPVKCVFVKNDLGGII